MPDRVRRARRAAYGGSTARRETLEILYKGRSIADALEMTIEEAAEFFDAIPSLARRLRTPCDVGSAACSSARARRRSAAARPGA